MEESENYPSNLVKGKLTAAPENDIHYRKALAHQSMGKPQMTNCYFQPATQGNNQPVQAIFYNDPQPGRIFYQGSAWVKSGNHARDAQIFKRLIEFGQSHLSDEIGIDYFAVSLPDLLVFDADLNLRNKVRCPYLSALGNMGLRNGFAQTTVTLFNKMLGWRATTRAQLFTKKC